MYYYLMTALTKYHKMDGLKQHKLFSHNSGGRKPKTKGPVAPHFLGRLCGRSLSCLFSLSWLIHDFQYFLASPACDHITPVSLPLSSHHFPSVCLCLILSVCAFLIRTPVIVFKAYLGNSERSSRESSLNWIWKNAFLKIVNINKFWD